MLCQHAQQPAMPGDSVVDQHAMLLPTSTEIEDQTSAHSLGEPIDPVFEPLKNEGIRCQLQRAPFQRCYWEGAMLTKQLMRRWVVDPCEGC